MATSDGAAVEVHGTTVRTAILSWYDETRPMWIDLIGDYAGKELFLIEGDSLLRDCFADERIDFQRKICFSISDSFFGWCWGRGGLNSYGEYHIGEFTTHILAFATAHCATSHHGNK